MQLGRGTWCRGRRRTVCGRLSYGAAARRPRGMFGGHTTDVIRIGTFARRGGDRGNASKCPVRAVATDWASSRRKSASWWSIRLLSRSWRWRTTRAGTRRPVRHVDPEKAPGLAGERADVGLDNGGLARPLHQGVNRAVAPGAVSPAHLQLDDRDAASGCRAEQVDLAKARVRLLPPSTGTGSRAGEAG